MSDKHKRLEATIAGEIHDRVPISLWRHFPVDDQDPEALAQSIIEFQKTYDFDFIKVTPASSFCLRDWGSEDEWRGDSEGTRAYTHRVVNTADDWGDLTILNPDKGNLQDQLRCLAIIKDEFGDEVPVIQTIFSPLAQAKNLTGQQKLIQHLHREPEKVLLGLETITQTTIAFIARTRELGIDGIFYALQHATYQYFDRASYARFGEGFDYRILESSEEMWLNVLHLHGMDVMFDLVQGLPVQVVNWHDRETTPDLAAGNQIFKGAVCGGIHRKTITYGDPAAVRDEAEDAMKRTGRKGLILGTGCVVPVIAPRSNILAARSSIDFA
jgi:uroporphyrinogen decarboxylase